MYRTIYLSEHETRKVYVTYDNDTEYWNCEECEKDIFRVADWMKRQGIVVAEIDTSGNYIKADRTLRYFNGDIYFLHQCDGDLIEWFRNSLVGSFTYYFDKIIFNTEDGFIAAYRDNIKNNWKI